MLGAAPGCSLAPAAATTAAPTAVAPHSSGSVLVYGTSITQGGVVSRPGAAWTNILSRSLSRPVYNFGFSGNGEMEINVTQVKKRLCRDATFNTKTRTFAKTGSGQTIGKAPNRDVFFPQYLLRVPNVSAIVIDCNPNMHGVSGKKRPTFCAILY